MSIRSVLGGLGVFILSAVAAGQSIPPALMVAEGGKSRPLGISKAEADIRVAGAVAQTRMTLTFVNPHDRVLAGDLYFPLPEGATVCGYALDINGAMVDGVAVEKHAAREVFEKIVRRGVDPGLVEWTKGNNFKTRVFPIPARGSRTIRIDYLTEVADGVYRLPLNFKDKLAQLHVRMDVAGATETPTIRRGPLTREMFKPAGGSLVAEATWRDVTADKDLIVALPDQKPGAVAVEKAPGGGVYFAIHDAPPIDEPQAERPAPKYVVIYWDASGSRAGADLSRQIDLLKGCFGRWAGGEWSKRPAIRVDLVVFRDVPATPETFMVIGPDPSQLIERLRQCQYDGGTQIGALAPPAGSEAPDFCLLFSDGISSIGREMPQTFKAPVYAVSASQSANHPFLQHLAATTGGRYLNLARVKDAEAVAAIGATSFGFLSAAGEGIEAASICPATPTPLVGGRFLLVGKLTGRRGQVTIRYGRPGGSARERTFAVSADGAAEGTLLERFWAQKKLEDLVVLQDRNREAILALGREHGLVTPFTSLLVLDSLDQYVENRIAPPRSLPAMREEYMKRIDTVAAQKKQEETAKIDAVLAMWKGRVGWWNSQFKYAKDFKYKAPVEATTEGRLAAVLAPSERPSAQPGLAPRPSAPPAAARDEFVVSAAGQDASYAGEAVSQPGGRGGEGNRVGQPGIAIKEWDPKTPYLEKLKIAKPQAAYGEYMALRGTYKDSPAFFLDCANFFFQAGQKDLGMRVLSNVAEMELENPALLRVLGQRLSLAGEVDLAAMVFEEVLKLRPEEPQSYRDLALVLAERKEYARAIELLNRVVMGKWDERFAEIELTALVELNALIPKARAAGVKDVSVDARLVQPMDLDVRIVMTWDADATDMDLHVIEPSGEEAFYGHNRTTIGGLVSKDFTRGYGPEEYLLHKAMTGMYTVQTNFYGSSAAQLIGAVTLRVDVYTNYGRPNEARRSMTLRLTGAKDKVTVGQIEF